MSSYRTIDASPRDGEQTDCHHQGDRRPDVERIVGGDNQLALHERVHEAARVRAAEPELSRPVQANDELFHTLDTFHVCQVEAVHRLRVQHVLTVDIFERGLRWPPNVEVQALWLDPRVQVISFQEEPVSTVSRLEANAPAVA